MSAYLQVSGLAALAILFVRQLIACNKLVNGPLDLSTGLGYYGQLVAILIAADTLSCRDRMPKITLVCIMIMLLLALYYNIQGASRLSKNIQAVRQGRRIHFADRQSLSYLGLAGCYAIAAFSLGHRYNPTDHFAVIVFSGFASLGWVISAVTVWLSHKRRKIRT
jgi:hypothetical protein